MLNTLRCLAVLPLALSLTAVAQSTTAPTKSASCHVNTVPETDAQIKNDRFDFASAATAYETELRSDPKNEISRAGQIRNLADMGKLVDAELLAAAFVKDVPADGTALTAQAYVMFKDGHLPESYALNAQSQKVDPCNARTYLYLADYERSIAMWRTASKHIELAHKLDPISDDITHDWIEFLPRAQALPAIKEYAQHSRIVKDDDRATILKRIDEITVHPPTTHACRLQGDYRSTHFKLFIQRDPSSMGGLVNAVPMTMNGKNKHLELDTGATGIYLTPVAASNLGLTEDGHDWIAGFGDDKGQTTKVSHVATLRIGDLEFRDCVIHVTNALPEALDGIFGPDVLSNFLITLDYPGEQMALDPLPPRPEDSASAPVALFSDGSITENNGTAPFKDRFIAPSMASWTSFYRLQYKALIPTQLNKAAPVLFMMDTGSFTTAVSTRAAKQVTKLTASDDALYGASGVVKNTFRTGPLVLHFGSLYQPMSSMLALDTIPATGETTVDGVFGMPTWQQTVLHLDYRDNLMQMEYKAKK